MKHFTNAEENLLKKCWYWKKRKKIEECKINPLIPPETINPIPRVKYPEFISEKLLTDKDISKMYKIQFEPYMNLLKETSFLLPLSLSQFCQSCGLSLISSGDRIGGKAQEAATAVAS